MLISKSGTGSASRARFASGLAQRGSSLLEVLMAVVVLSVGMLAFVNMQAVALASGKVAQFQSIATHLASDYVDRMRANAAAALAGDYEFAGGYNPGPVAVPVCAMPGNCTAQEMARIDIAVWRNIAVDELPGGGMFALMDPALPPPPASPVRAMDFWVIWRDPALEGADEAGENCPAAVLGAGATALNCMHFRIII
ncbi:MAG: type IV pilus modification protein PilV [Burkholderiaceae bacterium]